MSAEELFSRRINIEYAVNPEILAPVISGKAILTQFAADRASILTKKSRSDTSWTSIIIPATSTVFRSTRNEIFW